MGVHFSRDADIDKSTEGLWRQGAIRSGFEVLNSDYHDRHLPQRYHSVLSKIDFMYGPEAQHEMARIEVERDANTAGLAVKYATHSVSSARGSGCARILTRLTLGPNTCHVYMVLFE